MQSSKVAVPVQIIGHVAYVDESTVRLQVSCLVGGRRSLLHSSAICAVECVTTAKLFVGSVDERAQVPRRTYYDTSC